MHIKLFSKAPSIEGQTNYHYSGTAAHDERGKWQTVIPSRVPANCLYTPEKDFFRV